MKLAIMQPYFFPYIGYYSLIKYSEKFIIFDTVQFIRHGWIDRNRILKPKEGWQYIQVPLVKHNRETLINEIEIKNADRWKERLIAQLHHYKKRSPYYDACMDVVQTALSIETDSIVNLNEHILKITCQYLNINYDCSILSEMGLNIDEAREPDEWALNISMALEAQEYINPPGGQNFFNREKYTDKNILLTFLSNNIPSYSQKRITFEPGLSIIDLMMFNDVTTINTMIDDNKILS